jgi:hypothetical protein
LVFVDAAGGGVGVGEAFAVSGVGVGTAGDVEGAEMSAANVTGTFNLTVLGGRHSVSLHA